MRGSAILIGLCTRNEGEQGNVIVVFGDVRGVWRVDVDGAGRKLPRWRWCSEQHCGCL